MISGRYIGHEFPRLSVTLTSQLLNFFAISTGQIDPIYFDKGAALRSGYPDIVAPPTWPVLIDGLACQNDTIPVIQELDLDQGYFLHGEQAFEYYGLAFAGNTIDVRSKIIDIYSKKSGALQFIVQENQYFRNQDEMVANARYTFVYTKNEGSENGDR